MAQLHDEQGNREVLLGERNQLNKRAIRARKTGRPLSSEPRILEDGTRFDRSVAPVTRPKQHIDSSSRVRDSVAPPVAVPRQPPVAVMAQKPQRDSRLQRLPAADRQIPQTKTERRPVIKRALNTTVEYSKPAIALAGPVHSKIVAVSAEQVQREREKVAQCAVQRPARLRLASPARRHLRRCSMMEAAPLKPQGLSGRSRMQWESDCVTRLRGMTGPSLIDAGVSTRRPDGSCTRCEIDVWERWVDPGVGTDYPLWTAATIWRPELFEICFHNHRGYDDHVR